MSLTASDDAVPGQPETQSHLIIGSDSESEDDRLIVTLQAP
eukprot:CAMPEP_0113712596 /NCGR_PEP_ID=MMETSP0038_2-20120614/31484_1 /TAXON_ID=2898 /ORGANISM="Cryptomonas paramecium" /LENGTH=40 /DNA_ID=CAMNT_0000639149 /DNA_START=145 /DNA_END=264 /DNA_ORIENTATION=+ /assembly_acc=CAM_ASM_000170